MKRILILGGGTAGTMMANKLDRVLPEQEWLITVVDQYRTHYYQPGFLFIPFGIYDQKDVEKPKRDFLPPRVRVIFSAVDRILPDKSQVQLEGGKLLGYDFLIIATGVKTCPEETEGLAGEGWRKTIFDFYTVEGAVALGRFLKYWEGGRLVLNVAEMPIKCPVAPLEFVFLADWFFTERGIRDRVELQYVTPLPGAFTKPRAAQVLGGFLQDKNIALTTEYDLAEVDPERRVISDYEGQEIPYDLLVTVPVNKGDELIARSGMGNEFNLVPTDPQTLRSKAYDNVFVIGDATDLPSSKAGSVAHFEAEILQENLLCVIEGREPRERFDGHANCYIESGFGKGILIDFNYETEPLPGHFPLPGIGPFSLLEETRMNHYGKMMFRWMYWHLLLKGAELPISSQMMMEGKRF
jgi:sulfide:quinone oxidoreductase